jgi:hypothetical protein
MENQYLTSCLSDRMKGTSFTTAALRAYRAEASDESDRPDPVLWGRWMDARPSYPSLDCEDVENVLKKTFLDRARAFYAEKGVIPPPSLSRQVVWALINHPDMPDDRQIDLMLALSCSGS